MKKLLLVLLMLPFVAYSQTITVQDQQTLEPVPFANISGPNSTGVVTDINGKADITQWADTTELRISFLGYETRKVWKYEIKDKINIEADLASKSAVEKLEKIGGSIQLKK